MEDTIFGKITRESLDFLYQDEQCVVIKDIYPRAPTHILIVPKTYRCGDEDDQLLLGHSIVAGKSGKAIGCR